MAAGANVNLSMDIHANFHEKVVEMEKKYPQIAKIVMLFQLNMMQIIFGYIIFCSKVSPKRDIRKKYWFWPMQLGLKTPYFGKAT